MASHLSLPFLALVTVIVLDVDRSPTYTAEARVSMNRISDSTTSNEYEYDDYYDLLSSDFILDDTVEIVRGNVFAAAVAERLAEQGISVSPETVDGALTASREHRILTISSSSMDSGLAVVVANVAAIELREDFSNYIGQEGEPLPITIRPVDVPTAAASDTLRTRTLYVIVILVAAGFGFLLALALEYFDDSLDRNTIQAALGINVLGVVREDRK
ncbi:MAG: hypothetical protein R2849_03225 [Thermomicrobiales bacterium]